MPDSLHFEIGFDFASVLTFVEGRVMRQGFATGGVEGLQEGEDSEIEEIR
jgi:hypothetical protein